MYIVDRKKIPIVAFQIYKYVRASLKLDRAITFILFQTKVKGKAFIQRTFIVHLFKAKTSAKLSGKRAFYHVLGTSF
jgi:hypothetical protein